MALHPRGHLRQRIDKELSSRLRSFVYNASCFRVGNASLVTAAALAVSPVPSLLPSRAAPTSFPGNSRSKARNEWLSQRRTRETQLLLSLERPPPRVDWRLRSVSQTGKFKDMHIFKRRVKLSEDDFVGSDYGREIETYKSRFLPLIEAEQEAEEALIKNRLAQWGIERLVREGYCIKGLQGTWLEKRDKDDRLAARFTMKSKNPDEGLRLPQNLFSYGSQVFISRFDPLKEKIPYRGSVVRISAEEVDVAFQDSFEELDSGSWRLDLGCSLIAYDRMRAAIEKFECDPQFMERNRMNSAKEEVILQGTALRDVLLKSFIDVEVAGESSRHAQDPGEPHYLPLEAPERESRLDNDNGIHRLRGLFMENELIRSWAQRYQHPNPIVVEGDPNLSHLNTSQIRAVAMMIGERISLIQGPPGTGKTKTIVETISLLKKHFSVPHPILVCTYTNVAVDNLLEGFAAGGMKPLRVGMDHNRKEELEEFMFEWQFDRHALKPKLDALQAERADLQKEIKKLLKEVEKVTIVKAPRWKGTVDNMKKDLSMKVARERVMRRTAHIFRNRITRELLERADVICTTCIRSSSYTLSGIDLPVVFLDEASMSTEPASLIPLMKGCKHLALIGDHKQLPPVVISDIAKEGEFDVSLFERLIHEGEVPSIMLDIQYRMHPTISKFPSTEFYDTMLLDGTVNSGVVVPSLSPPSSTHLVPHPETGHRPSLIFIDHQGPEAMMRKSRVNWTEGYIICSIVEDLLYQNPDLSGRNIGIIAPYKSQESVLKRLLSKDMDVRDHLLARLGEERASEVADIEVDTVDGFEGREKDAIIFSTVRNNELGHIGFLADRRRLNVGLTRAKRALFVVGSMSTLNKGKYGYQSKSGMEGRGKDVVTMTKMEGGAQAWRNYAQFLSQQKLVVPLRGTALAKVLQPFSRFTGKHETEGLLYS